MASEEKSFENVNRRTDGRTDNGRKVITIAHPEQSSGELKKPQHTFQSSTKLVKNSSAIEIKYSAEWFSDRNGTAFLSGNFSSLSFVCYLWVFKLPLRGDSSKHPESFDAKPKISSEPISISGAPEKFGNFILTTFFMKSRIQDILRHQIYGCT